MRNFIDFIEVTIGIYCYRNYSRTRLIEFRGYCQSRRSKILLEHRLLDGLRNFRYMT